MPDKKQPLLCGCCGVRFNALQDWNHDQGYGICWDCIDSNINRMPFGRPIPDFEKEELLRLKKAQFPNIEA